MLKREVTCEHVPISIVGLVGSIGGETAASGRRRPLVGEIF